MPKAIRILIADDEPHLRRTLKTLLGMEDGMVIVAEVSRGDEVTAAAKDRQADIALLDVEMPGADGITATRDLREFVPSCAAIILVTLGKPGLVEQALAAGAKGVIFKESAPRAMASAIRQVMAGDTVIEPGLEARGHRY